VGNIFKFREENRIYVYRSFVLQNGILIYDNYLWYISRNDRTYTGHCVNTYIAVLLKFSSISYGTINCKESVFENKLQNISDNYGYREAKR
jgi:hypothetical protein